MSNSLESFRGNSRTHHSPRAIRSRRGRGCANCQPKPSHERGRFTIALSGGSTPKSLFNLLATNARTILPWDKMFFFWGDERHVPPGDPESNYRMAAETMLSKVPVPPGNVFRFATENPDAAAVADNYEKTLRKFFQLGPDARSQLRSDPSRHGPRRTHGFAVSRLNSASGENAARGRQLGRQAENPPAFTDSSRSERRPVVWHF